jgi:hypothetical protein
VTESIRVEGVAETLRVLQRINPELRRELIRNLKQVTRPVTDAIKGNYTDQLLSGTTRNWAPRGRTIFPYARQKAVSGVKVTASTSKRTQTVLAVTQRDPAASVFDMAGRKTANRLGQAFDTRFPAPSRVMWRSYEQADQGMMDEIQAVVTRVEDSLTALQKAIF